jgi:YaiO family outer membrane protein
MLIPVALLSVALVAGAQQAPDAREKAEQLARSGEHAEALRQFQAIAAANPDDIEARLWIGRLHALMGHQRRAVDVFQSIIASNPDHVEALIGAGNALTDQGRYEEAAEALDRAESLAADRPAVLAAQGRMHARAGRGTLGAAYLQRAVALQPDDAALRAEYEQLRAVRAHWVEGSYYFESFDNELPNTNAGLFQVNGRVSDSTRAFGAAQFHDKFDEAEFRGGGGIEWTRGGLHLRASGLFGDTVVLPSSDVAGDVEYAQTRVVWLVGFRYLDFDADNTWIASPGITLFPRPNTSVTFRYYHSSTSRANFRTRVGNDSLNLSATSRVRPHVRVTGGYARGFESLSIVTAERLSQTDANVLFGNVSVDVRPMTTIRGIFEHEWRSEPDVRVQRLIVSLMQRF